MLHTLYSIGRGSCEENRTALTLWNYRCAYSLPLVIVRSGKTGQARVARGRVCVSLFLLYYCHEQASLHPVHDAVSSVLRTGKQTFAFV